MSDLSPTARALRTLELVQQQPGITADRIAERLDVSGRAARRYVAILREAGVPISSLAGPAGGYRLGRGLRMPPLVFSQAEALSLVMAVLDGHHDPDHPRDPVATALATILRSLPEAVAAQADLLRRSIAPAPDLAAARPDPTITVTLVQACAERRRVWLTYRSEAGTAFDVEVEPWSVLVRHGRWYLLCRTAGGDVRTYRVDRVGQVRPAPGEVHPPEDLDPLSTLEEHLASGWEYRAEVVLEAPVAEVAVPRMLGRLEPLDERTTRLTGTTSNPWWYAERLATIPVRFRVLGGDEVREATRAVAERLLAATR